MNAYFYSLQYLLRAEDVVEGWVTCATCSCLLCGIANEENQ